MVTGDLTVTGSTTYDVAGSRLISAYRFARGAQEVHGTAIHHVYTTGHLGGLLVDAGFADIGLFGGPDAEPYAVGAGRLLLTGRRTG